MTSHRFRGNAIMRYGGLDWHKATGFGLPPFLLGWWLGMAKDFSLAFYHSAEWERARRAALERDHYLCQHCLAAGVITPATMVHHIKELTPANVSDPDYATSLDNLVSLCDRCHKKIHGWIRQGATRKGMTFDADGNLIRIDTH